MIAAQAQFIGDQSKPERRWSIVVKDTRLDKVCASVQRFGHIDARNLFPIAILLKTDRNAVDFHFGMSHSAKTQTRPRRLVHQNKLAPECCIEVGKPMGARSTAPGKTIHSVRRSRSKKLMAGSCHAIRANIDIVTPANATIKITRCRGLKTDIVDPTFSMFLAGHRNLGALIEHSPDRACLTKTV